jgi:hypothetical protein
MTRHARAPVYPDYPKCALALTPAVSRGTGARPQPSVDPAIGASFSGSAGKGKWKGKWTGSLTLRPYSSPIYEFIDGEVSGVLSNFHLDHATHRRRSPFKHSSDEIHIAVHSE